MTLGKWIGFSTFILSLYVIWQIKQLILLLLTAVILANALNILVKKFQKLNIKRGYAVMLTFAVSLAIIIGFFWLIVPPFVNQFQQLAELVPLGMEQINIWINKLENRIDPTLIESLPTVDQLFSQLEPLLNRLLGGGWTVFSSSLSILLNILLVIVITLMLLVNPSPYRQGLIRLFPSFYRRRVDIILQLCEEDLQGWLVGILFNMAVIFIMSFIALLILQIPLALSQATLAGLFTFIPNIGPALSVVPPIALSLLEEPWKAIAVLGAYVLIQQIESNLLTPLVMAQQVSLLPAFTLLAQVFFASFFGFLGLFLALPLTVIAQVWIKEALIKDILDRWERKEHQEFQLVPVTAPLIQVSSLSEEDKELGKLLEEE